jgi:2-succinyl-5-enolpyruvyl-6-hydroxy-3-cyclohexene-1-carboxylate synthase
VNSDAPVLHPSAAFARELVAALAANGVQDFVLCPGSRSGPVAHALAEAASSTPPPGAPAINLHVRIDERTAGFLGVGLARGRALAGVPRPVAILTTSGTAVGNLLPAVMEAHHSGLPLILLTADRPGELRGIGANQTTDQVGIFGTFVRHAADVSAPEPEEKGGRATRIVTRAVRAALGEPDRDDMAAAPGPVHINIEFRDPLGPDAGTWPQIHGAETSLIVRTRAVLRSVGPSPRALPSTKRGIVIAGDGAGDAARKVAEAHGWPLLAEPTSGARSGENAIGPYVQLLLSDAGKELASRARVVVVIGRPTLSRPVQRLIANAPKLYVAAHGARWREAPRHAERVLARVPDEWLVRAEGPLVVSNEEAPAKASRKRGEDVYAEASAAWLDEWRAAAADLTHTVDRWDARGITSAVIASVPPGALMMLGSSGPIRAADHVAPVWTPGEAPVITANRGLSGIDGTVSTTIGMALATGLRVTALMGDLTFLHDAGGLLIGRLEERPCVRIVVINDGGGTIFSTLEHSGAPPGHVERVFTTPHQADIGALSAGYGVPHQRVTSLAALVTALGEPLDRMTVIEAKIEGLPGPRSAEGATLI